jgi:hypothetical protein
MTIRLLCMASILKLHSEEKDKEGQNGHLEMGRRKHVVS